jgi:dCTP deaminase
VPSTTLIVGTRPSVTSVRWTTSGNTLPERQHSGTVYGIGSAPLTANALLSKSGDLFLAQARQQWLTALAQEAQRIWTRALEELLSDIAGALLFGPAAVFSTYEMGASRGLDTPPSSSNQHYPPWRLRIRTVLRIVDSASPSFFPVHAGAFVGNAAKARTERIQGRLAEIRAVASADSDMQALQRNKLTALCYRGVLAALDEGAAYLREDCGLSPVALDATTLYSSLGVLIERLDHGIPPNATSDVEFPPPPVSLAEILNAGWFHRLTWEDHTLAADGRIDEERVWERRALNRLTLKSIEFANLAEDFKAGAQRAPSEAPRADPPEAATPRVGLGVLTRPLLLARMASVDLRQRLVVTPLLDSAAVGPVSIDVRLGNQFIVLKRESFPALDISRPDTELARSASSRRASERGRYQERIVRAYREPLVLHPRQLVIGSTLEYVQMPPGLMCYVIGKSTWGRMGLIIATATKVDPGFRGCITLEIVNEGEVPLILYPGLPIAQLVIHETGTASTYGGRYRYPIGPEFPKFGPAPSESFWFPPDD